jgi:hypothetical protein
MKREWIKTDGGRQPEIINMQSESKRETKEKPKRNCCRGGQTMQIHVEWETTGS